MLDYSMMYHADTPLKRLYRGSEMIWEYVEPEPPEPPLAIDETKVNFIEVNASDGSPTGNIKYYSNLYDGVIDATDVVSKSQSKLLFWLYIGKETGITAISQTDNVWYGSYVYRKITLNEGLKTIGDDGFISCKNLRECIIPSTVTSIGARAFSKEQMATYVDTTFTINAPENSISGAPWGCQNSTVVWTG